MLLVALVAGLLVPGAPALACSCAPPDLASWLPEADGAFVGRWIDRAETGDGMASVTFEVERVVKGTFGPKAIVRTNAQGSACGLERLGGYRTGLLLQRGLNGVWESNLCSMVPSAELLAFAGEPLPPDFAVDPIDPSATPPWCLIVVSLGLLAGGLSLLAVRARRARG
jgi:hypothetical protein